MVTLLFELACMSERCRIPNRSFICNTAFVIYGGGKMKPIELFYLLSNVKDRDEFVEILRANRIKPCRSKTKKKTT